MDDPHVVFDLENKLVKVPLKPVGASNDPREDLMDAIYNAALSNLPDFISLPVGKEESSAGE